MSSSSSPSSSLISGGSNRREKFYELIEKWSSIISILSLLVGIVWFLILPHKIHVHKTYMSENALSPGLVSSDFQGVDELTRYYEATKAFFEKENIDIDWIRKQFERIGIETYTQNFNVTNPFFELNKHRSAESFNAKNIYAIARAHRTPSFESIVISAPLTYIEFNKNTNKEEFVKNIVGIAQLFSLAKLAKTKTYWAKDLIFVVSDVGYFGIQAWLNSYFDINSEYIQSENLEARGGSIQAAINLQIHDPTSDKYLLKVEGVNGQLPNLDLFNTIIRICRNTDFKCGLDKLDTKFDEYEYYINSFENTIKMMFRQASGVPSSLHGFFLRHHIEALTMQGVVTRRSNKQNTLKMIRVTEGTLRSINNLLERFHQSFFFYILPNENSYVSIGMYMPPLGFLLLPGILQSLNVWQQLFKIKITNRSKPYKIDLLKFVLPDVITAVVCGIINYIGTSYFMKSGLNMSLNPKDAFLSSHFAITINSIIILFFMRRKIKFQSNNDQQQQQQQKNDDYLYRQQIKLLSWKIKKFIILISTTVFIGSLSLLNFSLSFFLALFYIPLIISIRYYKNIILKLIQSIFVLLSCPLISFSLLYLIYYLVNFDSKLNIVEFYQNLTQNFYDFVLLSKISNVWTYDLICLALYPLWLLVWFVCW